MVAPDKTRIGTRTFQGHTYVIEDQDVVTKRNAIADKAIKDGLTYKHAWWTAFQQYPRAATSTPQASEDDSTDSCSL